jgi:hypothetical protein
VQSLDLLSQDQEDNRYRSTTASAKNVEARIRKSGDLLDIPMRGLLEACFKDT